MMELSSWLIFLLSSSARNRYTISVCMTINAKCRNSPNNNISTPFRDLGSWHVPVMKFEWVEKYMTFKLKSCCIYHRATDDIQRTATNGDIRQTTYSSKFCCNQPTNFSLNWVTWKGPLGTCGSHSRHESDSKHRLRRQRRRCWVLRGSERKVLFEETRSIIIGRGIVPTPKST